MSYHPSHRKPPRQERWPNATPREGWPAYLGGDGYRDGEQAWGATGEFAGAGNGHAAAGGLGDPGGGYPGAGNGYGGYAGTYDGYREADGYRGVPGEYPAVGDGFDGAPDGLARAAGGYGAGGGHGAGAGYSGIAGEGRDGGIAEEHAYGAAGHPWNGYDGAEGGPGDTRNGYDGYDAARAGYGDAWDGHGGQDGYAWARDGRAGPAGYLDEDGYPEPAPSTSSRSSGPLLIAPDTFEEPGRLPGQGPVREPRGGLIIGAVTGFLAAAVAIGVSTLAAAFIRPQAAPIIAVGGAFIDRTPPALKNFAVEHFGENDKTVLLLGMYVTIALLAIAIGCLARRNVTIGVAGIAAFGLFGAFVAITRPEGRISDVIPSVIGGIAGIAALLWLAHSAAPAGSLRHAYGGRWGAW